MKPADNNTNFTFNLADMNYLFLFKFKYTGSSYLRSVTAFTRNDTEMSGDTPKTLWILNVH
jgi:hypothetical protein